jgi:HD domain-containing protein
VTWLWVAIAVGGVSVAATYALCAAAAAGDAGLQRATEQRATPPAPAAVAVACLPPAIERLVALAEEMLGGATAAVLAVGEPLPDVPGAQEAASAPIGDGARHGRLVVVSTEPERSFATRELALLGTLADACAAVLDRPTGATVAGIGAQVDALTVTLGPARAELRWRGGDFVALAAAVGRRAGLAAAEQAELELAARLLDIGMLRVPRGLVDRGGPLTAAEVRLVRRHPAWGAEALMGVPGLAAVAMLVLCHHERWDGGGYPHGLSGDRIPLGARVLAGCDAWWAITTHRAFAGALGEDAAIDELVAASGRQLDARVVHAVLAEVAGVTLVA